MESGEEVASEVSRPWKGGRELQQVKLHQEQEKIIKGEGAVAVGALAGTFDIVYPVLGGGAGIGANVNADGSQDGTFIMQGAAPANPNDGILWTCDVTVTNATINSKYLPATCR